MTGTASPPQFPAPPQQARKAPNYAVGLILNIVWPGSGFTYLGRWKPHLSWMLGLAAFTVLLIILVIRVQQSAGATWPLLLFLLPVLAYVLMLIQYHAAYAQELARLNTAAPPTLNETTKLLLIIGHIIFNFFGIGTLGVLAAVILPNLLGAQARAYDSVAQSCARSLQTMEAVYQIDNQTYATLEQLSRDSAYEQCSGKNLVITPLKAPTNDDFVFSVYNKSGQMKYTVRPGSVERVRRGNSFSGE